MLFGTDLLVLILLIAYRKKDQDEAIHYHFICVLLGFLSLAFGLLRTYSDFWAFAFLNSLLLLVSSYFEGLALASLADSLGAGMRRYLMIALVASVVVYGASFVSTPHTYLRVVVISAANAFILVPPSSLLFRRRRDSALSVLLGLLFILLLGLFAVRVADALRLGPDLVLFGPSLGESLALPGLLAYLVLGGFGVVLLAKEKADAALLRLTRQDEGTEALNRHGFIVRYNKAFEKAAYDNRPFSVILAGLDNLSLLDETYGPEAADRVLSHAAGALIRLAGEEGFVGRVYGSMFIVFIPGTDAEDPSTLLASMDRLLAEGYAEEAPLSISAALVRFGCPSCKELDFGALYAVCAPFFREAKKAGPRGRIVRSV